jgi:hypothetical protein
MHHDRVIAELGDPDRRVARPARARQRDVAARALEQRHAELLLELLDLPAEHRTGWARYSRSAARPKCSSSATATK